jgi:hypothetical protein
VGFDVLTTCQPSTVWCSRERLPAAAAQPAKVRQSCSATDKNKKLMNTYILRISIYFFPFFRTVYTCFAFKKHGKSSTCKDSSYADS